ncbi:MAG: P1 family peptidase [Hyphomicrobiaceae bacterium]
MTLPRNLITDVAGLCVGNAHDERLASGVTAILAERPNVASVVVGGGAPGGRDTGLLSPEMSVEGVDGVVLSGGSAFGLDAAGGVMGHLRNSGVGLTVGGAIIPIVPQAIVFDLLNGGDKTWGGEKTWGGDKTWDGKPPYWELGRQAAQAAAGGAFALGTVGGGYGATTANLKGGLGSASAVTPSGHTVAAIVVVNAIGSATVGEGGHFWAAPFERNGEFGGLGFPEHVADADLSPRMKGGTPATTIALVATDAVLTKAQAKRLALMADDGLARALRPAHAPMDGDTVFAVATQRKPLDEAMMMAQLTILGMTAADCLARAVARGVFEATPLPVAGALPAWRDRYGSGGAG